MLVELRRWGVWVVGAALLGGACAGAETPGGAGGGATPTQTGAAEEREDHGEGFGGEEVGLGQALAQVRGHQLVALELYETGDMDQALAHAEHPTEEVIGALRGELEEHGAPVEELSLALDAVPTAIEEGRDGVDVEQAVAASDAVLERTEEALVGEAAASAAYRGSVIAALLATAAHEYEESLRDGTVAVAEEYQDGYGFFRVARQDYEEIAGDVEAASAEEAHEIEEAFETLATAFPSPEAPEEAASVEDVEAAAALIGHELEETVGALPLEEADPETVVGEIETLLARIVETYEAGRAEEAAELAAEAYLENYEVIEPEIIERAPEVNAELEPLLGAQLRRRIQEGAPAGEIEQMIARARELLQQALAALEGGAS